ncbi:MAG: glycosyltransferase family 1 protein [Actinomycetota bacterium]
MKGPAVNLLWCDPGRVGGSEQYLVRQLAGLPDDVIDELGRPTLYCVPRFAEAHADLAARYSIVTAPIRGDRRPVRVAAEHTWLARRTRSGTQPRLVHHGGGTAPSVGGRPIVLTVHDLQYETHPQYLHPVKLRYLRWAMPRSIARADAIAVPSEYVKRTIVESFDVESERIHVVPHGVEADLGADAPSAAELRSRHGLGDGPVLVLPAITHPHKGHRFVLEMVAKHWVEPDVRLVLLGGRGSADAAIEAAIDELGLRRRVVRPGRVPDGDRDGIIALADALVFPSEYEGFGAPVVEAMALGTPVISSDQPALAEVVGDAGIVRPTTPDAWADALDSVAARRDDLIERGRQRATAFTSARSGAALAAVYRSVAA